VFHAEDAFGFPVLLMAQYPVILSGEMTVVPGPHAAFLSVDANLLTLESGCLGGAESSFPDALANAVLLVLFALMDIVGMGGSRRGYRLGEKRGRCEGERGSEGKDFEIHRVTPVEAVVFGYCASAYERNRHEEEPGVAESYKSIFWRENATSTENRCNDALALWNETFAPPIDMTLLFG